MGKNMQIMQRGKIVGVFDRKTGIYSKIVDYNKGQIFQNPRWESAIGISVSILRRLIPIGLTGFDYLVLNLPGEEPFRAIVKLNKFMDLKEEVHFSKKKNADKQYILRLKHFDRLYNTQIQLSELNFRG